MVQGTGGYVIPPQGYFERLQEILEARKILIIDDEIQMGFYRTGKLWAIENFGIKPDVIIFGKALTNGMNPLSGIWAKEELINPSLFPPGSTHSTFASNPLGTAVGLETLKILKEDDYETITREKGAYFLAGIKELQRHHKIIGDVDGLGMALRIEICSAEDSFTPDREMMDRITNEGMKGDLEYQGKKYGLILDIGGYYKNVITLAPAFTISYEEIDMAMSLLDQLSTRCTRR